VAEFSVTFTPRAEAQLSALYNYIADRGGDVRAEKYVGDLVARCRAMTSFPQRGTKRSDVRPGLRTVGYKRRVTIAFSIEASAIVIHGIFYGGQDFERILAGDVEES
jgi:toxin ParE1/3/4